MSNLISLPYDGGRSFDVQLLLDFMQRNGMKHIIQGQQQVALAEHSKPRSLDYFIRCHIASGKGTVQAVNEVMEQLEGSGYFTVHEALPCPDSGRLCKGLLLNV